MKMQNLRKKFAKVALDLAKKDPRVVIIVADISHGVFAEFRKKFPNRYFNIGICEPAIVSMAAGLSKVGFIPFVHTIAPFLIERSYEQIKLDFAYQKLNVNLVSTGSSFDYSQLGCSHHCYSDVSLIKKFRGSQIFLPSSELELEGFIKRNYSKKKINYFRLTDNPHGIKLGKKQLSESCMSLSKGDKITVVAVANSLKNIMEVKDLIKNKNTLDIFYINSNKNIDFNKINKSVRKTKKLLVVEELFYKGGIYEDILMNLELKNVQKSEHIAIKDFVHGYGSYEEMKKKSNLNTDSILKKIKKILK